MVRIDIWQIIKLILTGVRKYCTILYAKYEGTSSMLIHHVRDWQRDLPWRENGRRAQTMSLYIILLYPCHTTFSSIRRRQNNHDSYKLLQIPRYKILFIIIQYETIKLTNCVYYIPWYYMSRDCDWTKN